MFTIIRKYSNSYTLLENKNRDTKIEPWGRSPLTVFVWEKNPSTGIWKSSSFRIPWSSDVSESES